MFLKFNRNFSNLCKRFCSLVSGLILSITCEYRTLAFTQAAKGAAATEARLEDFGSKESLLFCMSLSTACRLSAVILLASNDLISSLTPRLAKKTFMLFQEVSWIPINRRTPSSISRIISGGARNDLISDKASGFIFPTAALASLIKGSTSANSCSMSLFL